MAGTNLYYVDDSGDGKTCLTLTAIEVAVEEWRRVLRDWLGWRKTMYNHYSLKKLHELHSVDFLSGRGRPTPPGVNAPIGFDIEVRKHVYRKALEQIARTTRIRTFTIYRPDIDKGAIYHDLVDWIESELAAQDALGFMVVDGLDAGFYRPFHRDLTIKSRLVLEDAWMKDSRHCQFVQMADVAGYAAYQGIARKPNREFMWTWYDETIAPAAVVGSDHPSRVRGLA